MFKPLKKEIKADLKKTSLIFFILKYLSYIQIHRPIKIQHRKKAQ